MTLTLLANAPVQLSPVQITSSTHRQLPRQSSSFTNSIGNSSSVGNSHSSFSSLSSSVSAGHLSSSAKYHPLPLPLPLPNNHHPTAAPSVLDIHRVDNFTQPLPPPIDRPIATAAHPSSSLAPLHNLQHQDASSSDTTTLESSTSSHLRELMTTSSAEAPSPMSAVAPANQSSSSTTCPQQQPLSSILLPSSPLGAVSVATAVTTAVYTSTTASTPTFSLLPSSSGPSDIPSKAISITSTSIGIPLSLDNCATPSSSSPSTSSITSYPLSSGSPLIADNTMPSETRSWMMTQEIAPPSVTSVPLHSLHEATSMTHKKRPSWGMSVDYHHHHHHHPQNQLPTHFRQSSLDKTGARQQQEEQTLSQPQQAAQDEERQHQSTQPSSCASLISTPSHANMATDTPQQLSHSPSEQQKTQELPKRRRPSISSQPTRPWTNAEQESLYIAVEKHRLFGQWKEVQQRMKLERSVFEIEQEYMRIYGELPDTDEDDGHLRSPSTTALAAKPFEHHPQHGSSAPSTVSSPSSARSSFSFAGAVGASGSAGNMSLMARHEQLFPPIQYESIFEQDEDENEDHHHAAGVAGEMEVDYSAGKSGSGPVATGRQHQAHGGHRGSMSSSSTSTSPTRMRRPSNSNLPTHIKSASSISGMGGGDHHRHHHRTASESHSGAASSGNSSRPTRMVRVWTPEQSERLKNLIELYFPGAYRINWVWVAEQMGNSFTRKQCKNKWEIMRRRMGTEEEILLLKKGYEEFGPSWGEIQEKYLPERSRGGIEIMWELLESREAGQNQPPPPPPQLLPTVTQLKQSALPVDEQLHHQQQHQQQRGRSQTTPPATTPTTPLDRKQRAPGLSIATTSIHHHHHQNPSSSSASSPPPLSSKAASGGSGHHARSSFSAGGLATSDIEAMEISSPPSLMMPHASPHASISAPVSSSTTATSHSSGRERATAGDGWRHQEEPIGAPGIADVYESNADVGGGWRQHERTATGSSSVGMSIDSGSGSVEYNNDNGGIGSPSSAHQHAHAHEDYEHAAAAEPAMAGNTSIQHQGGSSSSLPSDRSAPMIWTEPLTRRLEQAIQEHFPNGEKVNWAKISALMGNNPTVSRDQCKRRWYLISQNQFYQRRHNEMHGGGGGGVHTQQQVGGGGGAGSPSSSMMMDIEVADRDVQRQQQSHMQHQQLYYAQHGQYSPPPLHYSHPRQHQRQHLPHEGWSE